MLIALLIIIYTLFILLSYGRGAIMLYSRKFQSNCQISLPFQVLIGLMVVTTLGSFASLFIRLNWEFQLTLFAGATLIIIWAIKNETPLIQVRLGKFSFIQKIGLIFFFICEIVLLYFSTLTPANADTGIYHAQAIHWIETYPVVPGLANLHERLGYDSSWLLANAIFSLSFLNLQSFHLLMGTLFLLMAGYFYMGINKLLDGKYRLSNFLKLGFFVGIFFYLIDQVSSPGTDAPTTLLIWFLITETVQSLEEHLPFDNLSYFFLSLLAFFCVTFKLSSAPITLLVIALLIMLFHLKKYKQVGWIILFATIILVPFVTRNFILTGYPVFPGFPFNIFHFDWTVPIEQVGTESKVIHWFAMLPRVPLNEFEKMRLRDQIIQWYYNLIPRQKAILLFIPIAIGFNVLLLIFKSWRAFIKQNPALILVDLTALLGCIFWFESAPAFRFGFGFLLSAVFLFGFLPIAYVLQFIPRLKIFTSLVILLFCGASVLVNVKPLIKPLAVKETLVMPAAYPNWSSQPCSFANFKLLCQAGYDECWYSPFPCAISGNENVALRGKDFSEGFKYLH